MRWDMPFGTPPRSGVQAHAKYRSGRLIREDS
jgi:hypothetical protein